MRLTKLKSLLSILIFSFSKLVDRIFYSSSCVLKPPMAINTGRESLKTGREGLKTGRESVKAGRRYVK